MDRRAPENINTKRAKRKHQPEYQGPPEYLLDDNRTDPFADPKNIVQHQDGTYHPRNNTQNSHISHEQPPQYSSTNRPANGDAGEPEKIPRKISESNDNSPSRDSARFPAQDTVAFEGESRSTQAQQGSMLTAYPPNQHMNNYRRELPSGQHQYLNTKGHMQVKGKYFDRRGPKAYQGYNGMTSHPQMQMHYPQGYQFHSHQSPNYGPSRTQQPDFRFHGTNNDGPLIPGQVSPHKEHYGFQQPILQQPILQKPISQQPKPEQPKPQQPKPQQQTNRQLLRRSLFYASQQPMYQDQPLPDSFQQPIHTGLPLAFEASPLRQMPSAHQHSSRVPSPKTPFPNPRQTFSRVQSSEDMQYPTPSRSASQTVTKPHLDRHMTAGEDASRDYTPVSRPPRTFQRDINDVGSGTMTFGPLEANVLHRDSYVQESDGNAARGRGTLVSGQDGPESGIENIEPWRVDSTVFGGNQRAAVRSAEPKQNREKNESHKSPSRNVIPPPPVIGDWISETEVQLMSPGTAARPSSPSESQLEKNPVTYRGDSPTSDMPRTDGDYSPNFRVNDPGDSGDPFGIDASPIFVINDGFRRENDPFLATPLVFTSHAHLPDRSGDDSPGDIWANGGGVNDSRDEDIDQPLASPVNAPTLNDRSALNKGRARGRGSRGPRGKSSGTYRGTPIDKTKPKTRGRGRGKGPGRPRLSTQGSRRKHQSMVSESQEFPSPATDDNMRSHPGENAYAGHLPSGFRSTNRQQNPSDYDPQPKQEPSDTDDNMRRSQSPQVYMGSEQRMFPTTEERRELERARAKRKQRDEAEQFEGLKNFKGRQRGWNGEPESNRQDTIRKNNEKRAEKVEQEARMAQKEKATPCPEAKDKHISTAKLRRGTATFRERQRAEALALDVAANEAMEEAMRYMRERPVDMDKIIREAHAERDVRVRAAARTTSSGKTRAPTVRPSQGANFVARRPNSSSPLSAREQRHDSNIRTSSPNTSNSSQSLQSPPEVARPENQASDHRRMPGEAESFKENIGEPDVGTARRRPEH